MKKKLNFILILILLFSFSYSITNNKTIVKNTLTKMINLFNEYQTDKDPKKAITNNKLLIKKLNAIIDYKNIINLALDKNKSKFSSNEIKILGKYLERIVMLKSYNRMHDLFNLKKIRFKIFSIKYNRKKKIYITKTKLMHNDENENWTAILIFKIYENKAKLISTSTGGIDLLKQYKKQFNKIIKKKGKDDLLKLFKKYLLKNYNETLK